MPANRSHLPAAERMGVLIASILLAYALTRLINSPHLTVTIALPGFYFAYPLTLGTGMTLLAALLGATGMNWLITDASGAKPGLEHLMLPTLTTFVLGAFLMLLPNGAPWRVGFVFSAVLLVCVFIAEHIAIDPSAPMYGFARAGLTALAYALFLITATALRFSSMRMFLLVPIIFLMAGLISLRILHLDSTDSWDFSWAAGIGIVCMQVGAGLHYWPLTPLQFGIALTGPFYALAMFSTNLTENIPVRRAVVTPALVICLAWVSAVFLR